MKNNKLFSGSYYPNKILEMNEFGDLGHHTDYKVVKKVIWKTDKLGFRNSNSIDSSSIYLIGDSFLVVHL